MIARGPSSQRVVVTGMGWATPLGFEIEEVWSRLLAGESAVRPVDRFPARTFATNFAAQVPEFDLGGFLADVEHHAGAHTHVRFLLAAASRAWRGAGIGDISTPGGVRAGAPRLDPRRVGVYLGSGEGEPDVHGFIEACFATWNEDTGATDAAEWAKVAYREFDARRETENEPNLAITNLAEAFDARGPAYNCMTACAASTQSVGEASRMLQRGDADVMIAGGSHTMIHPLGMTGFIRLTAMSTRNDSPETAARPFDASRDGFVMGEGAGVVVLERLEHALDRGATPLCEIVGYGSSADAYRITDIQPEGRGAIEAMRQAVESAGIDPTSPGPDGRPPVHYISAHGTGTQENDSIETAAVKGLFGDQAPRIPFSSIKGAMGHLIQAAGAVELITCVQAIRTGFVPPTINLTKPGPLCDLDYVPNQSRDMRPHGGVDIAMSNGFGFGGQNDAILVARCEEG